MESIIELEKLNINPLVMGGILDEKYRGFNRKIHIEFVNGKSIDLGTLAPCQYLISVDSYMDIRFWRERFKDNNIRIPVTNRNDIKGYLYLNKDSIVYMEIN
ncbi:hypothetical protein [Clostridium sp.]|uniref:hypothetical protein n=1 Tax=Clostridium sp. TaxID=1506 RepID=UPI0032166BEE